MRSVDRRLWQRYWAIATPFWRRDEKWKAWSLLVLLVLLLLGQTHFAVLFLSLIHISEPTRPY